MATPPQVDAAALGQLGAGSDAARESAPDRPPAHWSPALRVTFRFCFAYFTLFSLSNQIFGGLIIIPKVDFPDPSTLWPLRQITFWTARHIFHVTRTLVYTGSGSGDKTFDWVLAFCLLVFSGAVTVVWSILDRRRQNYVTLHKWFRLVIRFVLASEMLLYGLVKVVPLQMPFPSLSRLMEPYGNFSPMATLWYSVGASPAYEIFAGSAETLGAILLIIPRTATLGALVCLADLTQVFALNMTYDVPVKLFSFHLILFSLFLLAPEARRFMNFFFSDRAVAPSAQPPLFRTRQANRLGLVLQVLFGLYLAGMNVYGSVQSWREYGGGRQKPSLYGIWNVDEMSVDGQVRSPLLTDYDRWRRVIFDFPTYTSFERMDETFAGFGSSISDKDKTLTLTKGDDKKWKSAFAFSRPAPDELLLDGSMDGHKIHMQLKLLDRSKLTLVGRGFHWISEYPYQR
jgi:uncharacterized membrane protein YphA (DoxX/SURF4 family)